VTRAVDKRPGPRLLVLGLDGATLDLLLPWAAAGQLPHLAALIARGAHGPLRSTIPPITPCAWTTMMTGTNPGRHGVYDFVLPRPGTYGRRMSSARDRQTRPVWLLTNDAGLTATVLNVPTTYPPDDLDGYMLAGEMGAPDFRPEVVRPRRLYDDLKAAVGDFPMQTVTRTTRGYDLAALDRQVANREAAFTWMLDHRPADLFVAVVNYTDHLEHFFLQDRALDADGRHVEDMVLYGYQAADRLLGALLERCGPETNVLVVSDHGAGPLRTYVNIDRLLVEAGLLAFRGSAGANRGGVLRKIAQVTPDWVRDALPKWLRRGALERVRQEYEGEIDWSRTRVFRRGTGFGLELNVQGRLPEGLIPASEYELVREEIIGIIQQAWAAVPELGGLEIYRREELYRGPMSDLAPDIVLAPDQFAVEPTASPSPEAGIAVSLEEMHSYGASKRFKIGSHRLEGIFLAAGPGIRPGAAPDGAWLADITPTVLRLLDAPVPEGLDGRVLHEVLA
jgi:predicted AlkP superfamily phosphohydrolase/phosphomutase